MLPERNRISRALLWRLIPQARSCVQPVLSNHIKATESEWKNHKVLASPFRNLGSRRLGLSNGRSAYSIHRELVKLGLAVQLDRVEGVPGVAGVTLFYCKDFDYGVRLECCTPNVCTRKLPASVPFVSFVRSYSFRPRFRVYGLRAH